MENFEDAKRLVQSEENGYGINSREFQEVKKDFKDCKKKIDKLEWFLEHLVKSFVSEYTG